jgi:two-component system, sensor histidine kinase and response regulator
MKGDIWVESEADVGSTFYFSAWLKVSSREQSWKAIAAPISAKQVLVVDDNQANLDIMCSALKSAEVRVSDLRSGMEVVPTLERAIVAGNAFECCIIDIHMPGHERLRGRQADQALQESENFKIPLIAASYLTERDPEMFAEAGFQQSIIKPVRRERLFEVLAQVMKGEKVSPVLSRLPDSEQGEGEVSFSSAQILVAEDNAVNRKLIEMMLKKIGCKVVLAENGREAVEKFTMNPESYDLILMDIQMPEMDGFRGAQNSEGKGVHGYTHTRHDRTCHERAPG